MHVREVLTGLRIADEGARCGDDESLFAVSTEPSAVSLVGHRSSLDAAVLKNNRANASDSALT